MFSWLKGATQGANFPYDVKEVVSSYEGKSIWKLQNGEKRVDRTPVSVFSFEQKRFPNKGVVASNGFKRAKTLRHPIILPYLDGIEVPDNINIVTESVTPLEDMLEDCRKYPNSLSWGIYQITKALSFLNNDCNLIHGNLSVSSVFVNKAGDWKLGGLELVSTPKDTTSIIRSHYDSIPVQYRPLEFQKSVNWSAMEEGTTWALDSWMLATFIYEVYNGKLNKTEDLKKTGKIPEGLLSDYKQLLNSSPKSRLNPREFLESEFFENPYVETCIFLEEIALKEQVDKDKFFKSLEKNIEEFPQPLCKYKILPQLVIALDYGSANSRVLGPLLKIGKYLTSDEYNAQITPSVIKWFASPDRSLRINLLQNLEYFVEHLSPSLINDQIFPNVANGFLDQSPALRDLTVKSMLVLVPKLNERMINTQLLKFFAKLQMDSEPGIRTNTTICLANIAVYLSDATRQKIMAPAFCRSLRDPFPRARVAGIKALLATEAYYTKEDIATKILVAVSPLLIDPEKEVRDSSFQLINQFITKLEKISETGIENRVVVAQQSDASVLGWAFSSLSKKIYGENATGTTGQTNSGNATPTTISPLTVNKQDNSSQPKTSGLDNSNKNNNKMGATKSKGWSDDEFGSDDDYSFNNNNKKKTVDDDDDFTNTVYTPKKPLTTNKTAQNNSILNKTTAKPATSSLSLKHQEETISSSGWDVDDVDPDVELNDNNKNGWDVEIDQDDNGWEDDDDWDFKAKPTKLDMAKQKKQEKVVSRKGN